MIRGSIVALVTPMRADGSVDWERLRSLVNWHVEQGTHAIVAVGTTGESATLGFEEHDSVIREVVALARDGSCDCRYRCQQYRRSHSPDP